MGITESKIILEKLATACSSAEQSKQNGIQHVLSDKQFVKCLTILWNNLPGPSKDEITGRKRRRKSSQKLKNQQIEISALLKPNLRLWANEPKSFLGPITHEKPVAEVTCPVARYYQDLSVAETRSAGDAIRLRFLKVIFHHLKDRFCVSYLRPDAVNWLATRVAAAGLDGGDAGKISDKIKKWAYLGGKYDALCGDIGNYKVTVDYKYLGNLIRLPEDVTDRFILKELKVKGPDRKKVIDSLLHRGIYSNKGSDDIDCLADTIFCQMWNQIERYIPPDDVQHGRVFSSLKDWRKLHGTRVLRLQNGDCRTQVADEEEHHIGAKGDGLATWNQNAHARASNRCDTLSSSADIDENGRVYIPLSGSSGPSSFHGTSDPARSDVPESPASRSQGSMLHCGNTPISNSLCERDPACVFSPEASSMSPQLLESRATSEPEGTQRPEPILAQSTFTAISAQRNQNERQRSQVEHSGRQDDVRALQKTPRFDIAGVRREQNDTFLDGVIQIDATATGFSEVVEGVSQTDTNSISSAYWPGALDGVSRIDTNSAEWLESSIGMNGASLSESAPRLPLIDSTTFDHANIPTHESHNELYTLFDHYYTSVALPNPMLWSLFPPENQP